MHGVSQANMLSICSYYFHLVRASPLNIDRMRSWSCKQMLYKLQKLVAQPSKHYYLLENIRITFHQSSNKADPFLPPSSTAVINTWICILFTKSLSKTLSSSPLTKMLSCHRTRSTTHEQWKAQMPLFAQYSITLPKTHEVVHPHYFKNKYYNHAKNCELFSQNVSL